MGVTILKKIPSTSKNLSEAAKKQLPDTMRKISKYLQSKAQARINSNTPPPNSPLTAANKGGGETLKDSGQLMSSINAHSGDKWASAGTNLKYSKPLQQGATITPKKSQWLWIPAGFHVRKLMNQYNATKAGDLIPALSDAGWKMWRQGRVFMGKSKRGASPVALFILKKSVDIPARPFIYIDDADAKFIAKAIRKTIHAGLQGKQ